MSNVLTDEARYKAGKSQMGTFLSNQYLMWRIVSAKSIRKIILTADEFYTDILPEEITQDEDVVNNKIRNGWLYEAMAQSEQAIEDLFSLLKNSTDIAYFAKNVVNYRATEVKNYIQNFKYDDIEYFMEQFKTTVGSDPIKNPLSPVTVSAQSVRRQSSLFCKKEDKF